MNSPVPNAQPKRHLWKAGLLLALVFLLGLAGGAGGAFLIFQSRVRHALSTPPAGPAPIDRLVAVWEQRLASDLTLTESERRAVHAAFTTTTTRLKDLRQRSAIELREVTAQTVEDVGAGLPPDKAARAQAFLRERLQPWGLGNAHEKTK